MKSILRILADIALLPVSGCILSPNRDHSDNRSTKQGEKENQRNDKPADPAENKGSQANIEAPNRSVRTKTSESEKSSVAHAV